jgi:chemosensory pili system protein ChpA (sensor histidine kinase/response regulator)
MATFDKAPQQIVMLVDDDEEIREMMSEILMTRGIIVLQAANGLEAMGVLKETERLPSVVILDMAMPTMDGPAFLRVRARDSVLKEIPVLAISGSPPPKAASEEIEGFLRKPVEVTELLQMIGQYQ